MLFYVLSAPSGLVLSMSSRRHRRSWSVGSHLVDPVHSRRTDPESNARPCDGENESQSKSLKFGKPPRLMVFFCPVSLMFY